MQDPGAPVVGTITLIYDHHHRLLPEKLTDVQQAHLVCHLATTHVYLHHNTCLDVLVIKGESERIRKLADTLIGIKGVQHDRLVMTSPKAYLSKTT